MRRDRFAVDCVAHHLFLACGTDRDPRQGDTIDLSRSDAIAGGSHDAFGLIGSAAFGNVAGQLRVGSQDR